MTKLGLALIELAPTEVCSGLEDVGVSRCGSPREHMADVWQGELRRYLGR